MPRHDIAPPMRFFENTEWLAREIKAHPMTLAQRETVYFACIDAWVKLGAMQLNRALQRARRGAP